MRLRLSRCLVSAVPMSWSRIRVEYRVTRVVLEVGRCRVDSTSAITGKFPVRLTLKRGSSPSVGPLLLVAVALPFVSTTVVVLAIPPVLDLVVAAAIEAASNFSPFLANSVNKGEDCVAFFGGERLVVEVRPEVLVITLAALFSVAGANGVSDSCPVVETNSVDLGHEQPVLHLGPRASSLSATVLMECYILASTTAI